MQIALKHFDIELDGIEGEWYGVLKAHRANRLLEKDYHWWYHVTEEDLHNPGLGY